MSSSGAIDKALFEASQHLRLGRTVDAERLLRQVLNREPTHLQAMWLCAGLEAMRGELKGAARWLRSMLAHAPKNVQVLHRLADISEAIGDHSQAEGCYRLLIAAQPGNASLHYNLGCQLQKNHQYPAAIEAYRRAIEVDARFIQAYNNLGNVMFGLGLYTDAIQRYEQALQLAPDHLDATYNLALALKNLGRVDESSYHFERALAISPSFAPAMLGLGTLCHDQNDCEGALKWYERAAAADPNDVDALYNLGTLHMNLDHPEAALDYYHRALIANSPPLGQGNPTPPVDLPHRLSMVHFNLGRLFRRLGKTAEWLRNYHSYRLPANDLHHLQYGLEVAIYEGNHHAAEKLLHSLIDNLNQIQDADQISHLLSIVQYQEISQKALLDLYRRFNTLANEEARGLRLSPEAVQTVGRVIRLAYLSPDFNRHVMGRLMLQVISRHDRKRFHITLFSTSQRDDEVTASFRAICDSFIILHGLTAEQAAKRIAIDQPDILVDLAGHTKGGMPKVFAYRPAPLQLTHLGYHGALGLEEVDYKITDNYADLPGNSAFLLESLLPMKGCLIPFVHQKPADTNPSREECGIDGNATVFGVFVTHRKLSRSCLAAWHTILNRVPRAVLAFSTNKDSERQAILNNLVGVGIDVGRVVFIPFPADPAGARARYRIIDVVLDTFPYTGGDTTLAAIDMGVPVVSLCGDRQSERVTYSILCNLGVQQGIAHTVDDYIRLACRMAEDNSFRLSYAQDIAQKLPGSLLADLDSYTLHLEAAYLCALTDRTSLSDNSCAVSIDAEQS
jgi:protein O-GlcNAc transferase